MVIAAILIYGPWLFVQIFNAFLTEDSTWNLKKIGPGISEEKSFKDVDGRTDDERRRTASHQNSSSWAFGSGELFFKTVICWKFLYITIKAFICWTEQFTWYIWFQKNRNLLQ